MVVERQGDLFDRVSLFKGQTSTARIRKSLLQSAKPGIESRKAGVMMKGRSLSRSDVQELYTKSIDRYASFIAAFQSPLAMQALLRTSRLLRDGLRVLDAGCGFGMVTFALMNALREKNLDYKAIDAFDLTLAMLTRFRNKLET